MLYRLFKRFYTITACVTVLAGCDAVADKFNAGTTLAFQKCMDRGKDQPIERQTVKTFCIAQHQNPSSIEIWASGKYEKEHNGEYRYIGWLWNKSNDHILTSVTVILSKKAPSEGGAIPYTTIENIWIEPGKSQAYIIDADRIKFQPNESSLEENVGRQVPDQKGIKI
ncbi:hypothetical protein FV226_25490 [Methylobacterium sp. WL12]|uniref:hypothetical protein n=1 Tax=Methylobacterium sp. WL12 TaxID=2603890 RepID=UPI0011CC3AE2|nr:hypothetical protein [Methylobacterium sp. WL12]TXM65147.1 hypothetical protein FV226_25490 [Methylobacterium sp. WL12]